MRGRRYALAAVGGLVAMAYLANASWMVPDSDARPYLVAHRGVHQTFDNANVGRNECTANLIRPLEHPFIENTVPSIQAALESGASWVEIDIHPTVDGDFAVFHDWTLDCRTDGTGVVREQSMEYLRTLDAGWGYTPDGGRTYPLRGTAVGAIRSLREVFSEFPETRFVIDFKSNNPLEAEWLSEYLLNFDPATLDRIAVIGGPRPVRRFTELHPEVRGAEVQTLRTCIMRYVLAGWLGFVPESCQNAIVMVPQNHTWLLWGWPRRFEQRMDAANSEVWVMGDWNRGTPSTGLDTLEELKSLPAAFAGGIWTNRVEVLGAALQEVE